MVMPSTYVTLVMHGQIGGRSARHAWTVRRVTVGAVPGGMMLGHPV